MFIIIVEQPLRFCGLGRLLTPACLLLDISRRSVGAHGLNDDLAAPAVGNFGVAVVVAGGEGEKRLTRRPGHAGAVAMLADCPRVSGAGRAQSLKGSSGTAERPRIDTPP